MPSSGVGSLSPSYNESSFTVNDLDDLNLTEIFKRLPPYDRLYLRLVCKRWLELSGSGWTDIAHLDLNTIPGANINAIIKRCPTLRSAVAAWKSFRPAELRALARAKLPSIGLYNCSCVVDAETDAVTIDAFATVFSSDIQTAQWDELALHDFWSSVQTGEDLCSWATFAYRKFKLELDSTSPHRAPIPSPFSGSLKRLQLGGVRSSYYGGSSIFSCGGFQPRFERLVHLECLILQDISLDAVAIKQLSELENLREVSLGPASVGQGSTNFVFSLPKLEVLFLNDVYVDAPSFRSHLTTHPSLQILVIAGRIQESVVLSPRHRFPNGFDSPPVPRLHVFLGRAASRKVRVEPGEALEVHRITEPMPRFLQSEENAEIFKGVWIAKRICEGAKHGAKLWDYDGDALTLENN